VCAATQKTWLWTNLWFVIKYSKQESLSLEAAGAILQECYKTNNVALIDRNSLPRSCCVARAADVGSLLTTKFRMGARYKLAFQQTCKTQQRILRSITPVLFCAGVTEILGIPSDQTELPAHWFTANLLLYVQYLHSLQQLHELSPTLISVVSPNTVHAAAAFTPSHSPLACASVGSG
jgi:hypothetical protein